VGAPGRATLTYIKLSRSRTNSAAQTQEHIEDDVLRAFYRRPYTGTACAGTDNHRLAAGFARERNKVKRLFIGDRRVKAWLAARPRWHLHFVPMCSSWLNLVERFFALITGRAIRRGSFRSVRELIQRIGHFLTILIANPLSGPPPPIHLLQSCNDLGNVRTTRWISGEGRSKTWIHTG
jgi:hypothetical protein